MKKSAVLFVVLLLTLPVFAQRQKKEDIYIKINNAIETFSSILRAIVTGYVVEVDPEEFVDEGINSMLEQLDPYTVYIDENNMDNLEFITNGSYVGLGITVQSKDSMLTITDYADFDSFKLNGLKIGDRIYKVDSNVVLYKSSDELKDFTRGLPGSKLNITVLRKSNKDTVNLTVVRKDIKVSTVPNSALLANDIGYIKITNFNRFTQNEFADALKELKKKSKLNGLIIDLRENGGGLVESAVAICEMFVPENTVIVTTKGRIKSDVRVYRSINKPVEPDLPLAILIDNETASASEILAGTLQDLDRAVIVGKKSFGKGIVQSVLDMPFKANLKITTAKYYIPSGRCIQKDSYSTEYNKNGLELHYDSTFYTKNHRPVIESVGISPDSTPVQKPFPDFIKDVINHDAFFDFMTQYTDVNDSLPLDFKADESILKEFGDYLDKTGYEYTTHLESSLLYIQKHTDEDKLSDDDKKVLDKMVKKYKTSNSVLIKKYEYFVTRILEAQALRRFHGDDEFLNKYLKEDEFVTTASNLLSKENYNRILSIR